MIRVLMLFLLVLCAPAHGMNEIRDVQILEVPQGSLQVTDVAQNPDRWAWKSVQNHTGMMAKADRTYFMRFVLPYHDEESYVLHHDFRKVAEDVRPYTIQLFVLEGQHLRRLPAEKERFASFVIDRSLYGKTVMWVEQTGWFSTATTINMNLHRLSEFKSNSRLDLLFIGFIAGIVAIMSIYNFGLLLLFRKSYLLYYTIYASSALYWCFMATGMLWFSNMMTLSFHVTAELIHISTILFSFSVLNAKENFPRFFRWSRTMIGYSLLMLLLVLLGFDTPVYIYYFSIPLSFLGCFALALLAARDGDKSAYPMLLGWAGLAIGILLSSMSLLVDGWPEFGWAVPLSLALEIATFSFAIGQKLRISELTFQRENIHAFAEMRKMIYAHQLDQIRRGDHLETTMPTHSTRAVVMSFDVIGSSRIKHSQTREFFRRVFAQCNQIMAEGYDGHELKSNAYRIKEMGDGFLCSIGFPFAALSSNPAQDAVTLAKRFAEILAVEARVLQWEQPIACGIGIAFDKITGFYPEAGAKEYDLYGRSIVLATRYEGMRKILFDAEKDRSVLIIHDAVYEKLEPACQREFTTIQLQERGLTVRDDPSARCLHFQFLTPPALAQQNAS